MPSLRSATTTSTPVGSARVSMTAMVCGRASASTREDALLHLADAPGQRHGFRGGRALVEQRRTGGGQSGQVGDDGLEVQERLEAALRDLRLVRGVGGVPGRVLHDVAEDDRRREGAVVTEADHRGEDLVAVREGAQFGEDLGLAAGLGQAEGLGALDDVRHRGRRELVERAVADLREHLGAGLGVGPDVALLEGGSSLQPGERNAVGGHVRGPPGRSDLRGAPRRGCPDGLPLCHLNLRASPRPALRGGTAFTVGESGCRPTPALLSRVTSSVRYRGLRDSGEDLLLRRPRRTGFGLSGGLSRTGSAAIASLPAVFPADPSSGRRHGCAFS